MFTVCWLTSWLEQLTNMSPKFLCRMLNFCCKPLIVTFPKFSRDVVKPTFQSKLHAMSRWWTAIYDAEQHQDWLQVLWRIFINSRLYLASMLIIEGSKRVYILRRGCITNSYSFSYSRIYVWLLKIQSHWRLSSGSCHSLKRCIFFRMLFKNLSLCSSLYIWQCM